MNELFAQTNKKDSTPQILRLEHIQNTLKRMQQELDILKKLASKQTSSRSPDLKEFKKLLDMNGQTQYDIAVSQKDFLHLPTWLVILQQHM